MTFTATVRETKRRLRAAPRPKPHAGSARLASQALQAQLQHELDAIRAIETKATLVIPAFGVVAAFLAGHPVSAHLSLLATAAGSTAAIAAVSAIIDALRCLSSASYSVGADPVLLARATGEPVAAVNQAIVDSLAIAAQSARVVLIAKAAYLNRSFIAAGTTLGSLAAFGALGGFS
jgi:hypothetical protein